MMIKNNAEKMRKLYEGKTIRLIKMEDEQAPPPGTIGVCKHVDDMGQLHWSASGLALIPGVDEFEIVEEGEKNYA